MSLTAELPPPAHSSSLKGLSQPQVPTVLVTFHHVPGELV